MHESLEERDVLIIGGGFAGGYVARLLRGRRATIVSPENFMLYTPLLPEAASGTLEPRHTVVPLRAMCPHADLLLARAESLDLEARTATVGGRTMRWRDLVIALGAVPRTLPVPGLSGHGDLVRRQLREAVRMGAMDKLNDKAEAAKGDVKEKVGDATDNEQWQAEGKADKAKGNLKQAGEKVKDAF